MKKYLRFQASVFGDFMEIDLSQESMSKLYQIYLKEDMMPSVIKEFDVISQKVKNRPGFFANDNSINITIASNRIDIVSDSDVESSVIDKVDFTNKALKYLKEFFEIFQVGASRISYIEEGIIEMVDDPADDTLKTRFINSERVYKNDKVFEWSANSVSLDEWNINGKIEKVNLNVTTALRRINAMQNGRPMTRSALILTQDLNTLAENTSYRLNAGDMEAFLKNAILKSGEITAVVEG